MEGSCFICNDLLSVGKTVNVERGLQTLKTVSNEREDGCIEFLNSVNSVRVHVECRKEYIHKKNIAAFKTDKCV